MNTRLQRGFTLFELLVTVLVAGVIFGLGVPNLLEFSRNNTMTSFANQFQTAIMAAREVAVTQRIPVTLCASPDPTDASPTCSPDASGTDGGFIVWEDEDGDADVDGGEELIYQVEAVDNIDVVAANGYINFAPTGRLNNIGGLGNSVTSILLCDPRGNVTVAGTRSAARAIVISVTGRSSVRVEVDEITATGLACP